MTGEEIVLLLNSSGAFFLNINVIHITALVKNFLLLTATPSTGKESDHNWTVGLG